MAHQSTTAKTDHWSSESYKKAADFVPKLTTRVVAYLNAQPNDHILDIGCGDGILTAQIAQSLTGTGKIYGLDASQSFIASARTHNQPQNCEYQPQDCAKLQHCQLVDGRWDKVFSNAALHWILRNAETRLGVLQQIYKALKPGGKFVFEMGGKGNVAEIHAAFNSALLQHGVTIEAARIANPWFFPSAEWMSKALKDVGFDVEVCELEYRPTKVASLTDWLTLMGAQFLEAVDESQRQSVLEHVNQVLADIVTREEESSTWIGYVRLRAVACKTVA